MFYVVSYDIKDHRRRQKIFKLMKDYGKRVQYSVFECEIRDERLKDEMKRKIEKLINTEEDSVRLYMLGSGKDKKIEIIGQGEVLEYKNAYII